jgi:uncharacterized protein (DUF608 family)
MMRPYSRRQFMSVCAAGVSAAAITRWSTGQNMREQGGWQGRLFEVPLADRKWRRFRAHGFERPVSGVKFLGSHPPCCGVPLGGIGTGCLDVDARGIYGFSSVFNPWSDCPNVKNWRMPRKAQLMEPMLGLAIAARVWVMATREVVDGGDVHVCQDPFFGKALRKTNILQLPALQSVSSAAEIHYWGHYPVVDMEFETDAPVQCGLRGWSPFIPGDEAASNTPATVWEVHLKNSSAGAQKGTLVFNFPGPDKQEANGERFTRRKISEDFVGDYVVSDGGVSYVLGVIGAESVRTGGSLGANSWKDVARALPEVSYEDPTNLASVAGTSIAVDFELSSGESRVVRFLLAWYAPIWKGAERARLPLLQSTYAGGAKTAWDASQWSGENYYTLKYAERFRNALEVARQVALEHEFLLRRVLAWQDAIYSDDSLPVWLQDSLINNLCLLAEDALWVLPRPPLDSWAIEDGGFGLIESPRGDPDLACIPCDWYGNLPVVYFFPRLAMSNIRSYKHYQRADGAAPFWLGVLGDLPDFATPSYEWQVSLNGTCYIDMVDRVWQRTGDDLVLREFYESVKKCNTATMNLRQGPGAPISMPEGNKGMEWFEHGEWAGMCAHLGGLHLAELRIVRRMAEHMNDHAYARQCDAWLADGTSAMEHELWNSSYYLNFYEKETGKRSDDVMAYQLDGEWMSQFHGLGHVFREDRVLTALSTIRRLNVALTPHVGAANFAKPDGQPLQPKSKIAAYGPFAMFPAEVVVLAMTYIYAGETGFGLGLARRHWETIVCQQGHAWDMPNIVRGDTGERVYGTDYYQSMMLWALPAALEHQDIRSSVGSGSLVERVLSAGNDPRLLTTSRVTQT